MTLSLFVSIPDGVSQLRIDALRHAGALPRPVHESRDGARAVAVFDLDGTLVDTAPDLTASLNHCLRRAGLGEVSLDAVRPHAGKGVRIMLANAYREAGVALSDAAMEEQTACFLAYYEAHVADHSRLFPGALGALDRLGDAGFALAVCTNKYEALSRLLIEALGLSARFAAICGADTFQRRKPDPVHLLGTIDRAGGTPRAAVMIGDTGVDIDAAWACGIPSILVDFGYDADASARARADRLVRSFDAVDAAMIHGLIETRLVAG